MITDQTLEFLASGGESELHTKSPSTGDPDADAVLAEMAQSAVMPFDPDAYLEQKIAEESQESFDDELATLGPVFYATFTKATPEQFARQIERCLREDIPGWRAYEALCDWSPTTLAN